MCSQKPEVVMEFIYLCRGNARMLGGGMKKEKRKYKSERQTNIKKN